MVSLLQRVPFSNAKKEPKGFSPGVRHFAKAQCSLATVSIRGHRLRSASRRPPFDVCGFAARRYAPNPLMNTYARPAEGAKGQKQDQRQKPKQDQKIAAFVSSYMEFAHTRKNRSAIRPPRLILICPPLRKAEWRCSSGGRRVAPFDEVELIERRSSRSRP
jgi:hypothetical protein